MSLDKKRIGAKGEQAACRYLLSNGYKVIETNFATRAFEIDIIAFDQDTLCFIEVKTRTGFNKGLPREGVTPAKQKKMIMGAQYYLKQKKIQNTRLRFDVVEVQYQDLSQEKENITLIKNAFQGY